MAQVKPNFVDIWLFKGKNTYTGKTSGKVFGGILSFSQSDPTKPVVWLGQKSYTVMNLTNKKTTLLYDTLTHSLFRPSEMSIEGEDKY